MKKFYFLYILLAISVHGVTQVREWTGGNGAWNDASKWSPFGIPQSSDQIHFTNIAATISNVPDLSFKGIVVTGSNIILNAAGQSKTLIVGLDNEDLAFEINEGATFTIANGLNIALSSGAQARIDGVLVVQANTRFYTDNGEATHTTVNGRIQNSGEIFSKTSTLEFASQAVYEHAADKGTIPNATWDKTSDCRVTGMVTAAPSGLNQSFGNYIWDCPHQPGGSSPVAIIPAEIKGNLVINKAGKTNDQSVMLPLPNSIHIGGSLIIKEGNCYSNGRNIKIDLEGDFLMLGGSLKGTLQSNASIDINFVGTQKQVFSKAAGTIQGLNIKVANKASLDLGEAVLDGDGDFVLEAGARLLTAHADGIAATSNTGAVQVNGKRLFSSEAEYAYTGKHAQVTGTGLPNVVRQLIVDNKGGADAGAGVTLTNEVLVTSKLELIDGYIQTDATRLLTIGENATAEATDNSFVAGPMRKNGSTSFLFPTGWAGPGGGRIPIGIELLGSTTAIQAEYKRAPATDKGKTIHAPLHHINYCEYWELFPLTGSPKAIVTMYYNSHSSCNPVSLINDFSSTRVSRSDGDTWVQVGNAGDSLNAGSGYVISDNAGITISKEQRYYALGNITNATDPLPVMFDNVLAYEKNNGVNIEWSNLTERDIAIYFVERSGNGMDYTIIGQYLPKSNRDDKSNYTSFDPDPLQGTNFYRIKVIEKSTKIIFSKVMRIETGLPGEQIGLYPNPVSNKQVMLGFSGLTAGKYDIRVINVLGQPVLSATIDNKGNFMTQTLRLPGTTPPGVYRMIIVAKNYQETKTFIVQ